MKDHTCISSSPTDGHIEWKHYLAENVTEQLHWLIFGMISAAHQDSSELR